MSNCILASINKTFQDKSTDVSGRQEYQDQSKDILNLILNKDVLSDSDSGKPIEESWSNKVL